MMSERRSSITDSHEQHTPPSSRNAPSALPRPTLYLHTIDTRFASSPSSHVLRSSRHYYLSLTTSQSLPLVSETADLDLHRIEMEPAFKPRIAIASSLEHESC